MRAFGALHPTEMISMPADTVGVAVLAANAGEAFDMPAGAGIVRVSGATTAGGAYAFVLNLSSTGAIWHSTDSSGTTVSSGLNPIIHGSDSKTYQIPGSSTGYSVISPTSGIVTFEFWKR